jgi:hypothetical protein
MSLKKGQCLLITKGGRMRFRVVLFLALSGVTVLPVLALSGWIVLHAQEREAQIVKDTHLLLARNLGGALQRYARDVKSSFKLAAEAALLGDPAARRSVLNLMNDLNYVHLCVADFETGVINAGLFPKEFPCPAKVPGPRFETFKSLVEGEEPIFSPVMPNPRGEPTIYVLMRRMGQLVIGAISTQYFVERGSAIAFGKLGHAAIVDQTGTVLAHPRPDWLADMKNIAQVRPVAAMLRGETGTTTFFSPALQADMVAGYTTVPATGWGVMIPQPEAEVRESAGNVQNWAMVIAGVTSVKLV